MAAPLAYFTPRSQMEYHLWEVDEPYSQATVEYARAREEKHDFRDRIHGKDPLGTPRTRNEYWRDYGRILYSSSFRRLGGKMQMLGVESGRFVRTRLTHTLEVAQSARAIASSLRLRTGFVAESSALAHDLGNPPFGHRAEAILDELAADFGGFEGNAQTFRILHRLEKKSPLHGGLNLTVRTLLGTVKYFRLRTPETKKFLYLNDHQLVSNWLDARGCTDVMLTIDAQVMDRADELAYAAHDLEDCLQLGLFSIDELLHEFKLHERYKEALPVLNNIVNSSREFARRAHRYQTSEEYAFLLRKELMSEIVGALLRSVEYDAIERRLTFGHNALLAEGLKHITFKLISRRPSVYLYEQAGEKVIRGLYAALTDPAFNRGSLLLPPEYRNEREGEDPRRNVIDFISGMTDAFAVEQYKRYFGSQSLDHLYDSSLARVPTAEI